MSYWVFKCFVTDRSDNEIRLWLKGLPKKVQVKIEKRLQYLSNVKYLEREPQYIKPYKGYEGIYEIRVVFGGDQYRPLCCHGPGLGEITLLIGAVEKDWELEPKNAPDIALARKKLILSGRGKICDFFANDN